MYCIFLLYYTLNNLSLLCQGAASPFLRILLSYHSFHQSHLTPDLSKYLSAYPLNPILIPTRVALEVPIWTARAPIRLTLESARCPCSSFVPGNVGYESLLLASCFPPVLDLITGLSSSLEGGGAGSRRTQFIMICSHRLASPTSSTPARSIFCWLATYTRGSIFSRL